MGRTSEFSGKGAPIAAALAVVIRDGEGPLVQRSNPPDTGRWGFPGGKIEFGERLEAAAVREAQEETDYARASARCLDGRRNI